MADLTTQLSKFLTDLYAGTLGVTVPLASLTVTASVSAGTDVVFGGRVRDTATGTRLRFNIADGIGLLSNNAETGWSRLIFGTNDTSGVALNKSGTTLELMLGDTSAKTNLNLATMNAATAVEIGATMAFSGAVPTISSGFGTSPSVVAGRAAGFTVNVGTGGAATAGVIAMPTATTGWICSVKNLTQLAANRADRATVQTASTTTTVTVQSVVLSTGVAVAWTASDVLQITAVAY